MKTRVKALIVGGGAVGTGIAYALSKAGWSDVVLLERDELTAGSTWHAAGLLPYFNMGYATSHIHDHSIRMYKTLEAETGLNPGFSVVGNLRMAQTQARMDEYELYASLAETIDIPHEWMTPAQIAERWPLVRTDDLVGAIFHPTDGYINPADVTMAMAKGARDRGVTIERRWQVDGYAWAGDHWDVTCTKMAEKGGNLVASGEQVVVAAEHVVTATGNHAQRTARLLGVRIPAVVVEHQYIVTEPDPALVEYRKTMPQHPVLRDADAKWYVREERGGWILGPYEKNAPARFEYGVPDGFRADLFPLDLERIEAEYMSFIHRIPSSETAGLKDDYNGPICYTPDGNPLVGPVPGLRNMWLAEGFSFGITAAGGTGHYLAQMMTEGEAEIDMASLDPRRFGRWMTTEYAARKNEEAYDHVFILHHPDEERSACRPLKTAPCYDRMRARGAQFGCVNGWERPNYFGPVDAPDRLRPRRAQLPARGLVAACGGRGDGGPRNRRPDRRDRLHQAQAAGARRGGLPRLVHDQPAAEGRAHQPDLRADRGRDDADGIHHRAAGGGHLLPRLRRCLAELRQRLTSRQAINDNVHRFGPMWLDDCTGMHGVFALAGPNSRAILAEIVRDAEPKTVLSNARFPWLSARRLELLMCPVNAIRVAYTGELGWELHHPMEMQNYLFDRLLEAGEGHGLKLVGSRAQNWLRQEKSYRAFGTELGRDATPLEAGLDRFVDLSKEFHGKPAMEAIGIRSKCVTLLIDGPPDADPWGREALYEGDVRVGRLTSGGYSVAFSRSIGMGYVRPDLAAPGTKLRVRMQRRLWDAVVTEDSPYDPTNARIRQDG